MSGFGVKRFIYGCLFFIGPSVLVATEYWRAYDPAAVPWAKATAVVNYKGTLLVSGPGKPNNPQDRLWKSSDGKSWTPVPLPGEGFVVNFCEHNQMLYGFEVTVATVSSLGSDTSLTFSHVYQSSDGDTWVRADQNQFSMTLNRWSDSISFNGRLYAGNVLGEVWSTDGASNPPTWVKANLIFDGFSLHVVSFSKFQNYLYLAVGHERPFDPNTTLFRTSDGINWSLVNTAFDLSNEILRPGTVTLNNRLYRAGNYVRSTVDTGLLMNFDKSTAGPFPIPFLLDNQLHAFDLSGTIHLRTTNGSWNEISEPTPTYCAAASPRYDKVVDYNDMTFVLPCDLLVLKRGWHEIMPQESFGGSLRGSQQGVPVLKWACKINLRDSLTFLKVQNLGTAKAGGDIERVSLFLMPALSVTSTPQFIADLTPSLDGKSWATESSFKLSLSDGDNCFLAVDIASDPTDRSTGQFEIAAEGFLWEVNQTDKLPFSLIGSQIQIANTPPAATTVPPLEEVKIYPSPAKDTVNFLYSLSSAADVSIEIYERRGTRLELIQDNNKAADNRAVTTWDASRVAPGVYFSVIKITAEDGTSRMYKSKVVIER